MIVWSFFASEENLWEYMFQKWECCDEKVPICLLLEYLTISRLTHLNYQSMVVFYKLCDYHSVRTGALQLQDLPFSKSKWGLKCCCCEIFIHFFHLIFLSLHNFAEVGKEGRKKGGRHMFNNHVHARGRRPLSREKKKGETFIYDCNRREPLEFIGWIVSNFHEEW